MSLDDVTAVDLSGTNTAVVWALGTWETSLWPSVWVSKLVKESVLLLKTEPWLVGLVGLHELRTLMAVVELVWGSIRIPALGNNQNVGSTTERIGVDGDRSEVDIGVVTWGLSC